jgi:hypothetical protein
MKYRIVIDGLPDGRVNYLRMGGADCIHTATAGLPIAAQDILEMSAGIIRVRGSGRLSRASRKTVAASSH